MFESLQYDPTLYEAVVKNYEEGKIYHIERWKWGYEDKKSVKINISLTKCPTLEDFNREVWDMFADFAEAKHVEILFGLNGLKHANPYKPRGIMNTYFDGLIFGLIRSQFLDCMKHWEVSRFMSCLHNYGYHNTDFIVIDPNAEKTITEPEKRLENDGS